MDPQDTGRTPFVGLTPPPQARLRHAALFPPMSIVAGPEAWAAVRRRRAELRARPEPIVHWQPRAPLMQRLFRPVR